MPRPDSSLPEREKPGGIRGSSAAGLSAAPSVVPRSMQLANSRRPEDGREIRPQSPARSMSERTADSTWHRPACCQARLVRGRPQQLLPHLKPVAKPRGSKTDGELGSPWADRCGRSIRLTGPCRRSPPAPGLRSTRAARRSVRWPGALITRRRLCRLPVRSVAGTTVWSAAQRASAGLRAVVNARAVRRHLQPSRRCGHHQPGGRDAAVAGAIRRSCPAGMIWRGRGRHQILAALRAGLDAIPPAPAFGSAHEGTLVLQSRRARTAPRPR